MTWIFLLFIVSRNRGANKFFVVGPIMVFAEGEALGGDGRAILPDISEP